MEASGGIFFAIGQCHQMDESEVGFFRVFYFFGTRIFWSLRAFQAFAHVGKLPCRCQVIKFSVSMSQVGLTFFLLVSRLRSIIFIINTAGKRKRCIKKHAQLGRA